MTVKMRKINRLSIISILAVLGIGLILCLPRYRVVMASRSLSFSGVSNFTMSPAKIEITNLVWGFPLTLRVKIINSAGDMNYSVAFENPATFDKGYTNADTNTRYSYSWDKSLIVVLNNTTEVINIRVSKKGLFGSSGIEKGIAISQVPSGDGGNTQFGFSYIFEILIGGKKETR